MHTRVYMVAIAISLSTFVIYFYPLFLQVVDLDFAVTVIYDIMF